MPRILLLSKINWLLIILARETTEEARHNTCVELRQLYLLIEESNHETIN